MNLQKLYSWIKVSFNFNFKTITISDSETLLRENIWLEWFGLYNPFGLAILNHRP